MLLDMSEIVDKAQKALGREFLKSPRVINTPGKALACKIDPFYYLVIREQFLLSLGTLTGTSPAKLETALVKTGHMIINADSTDLEVEVTWEGAVPGRSRIKAAFLLSDFIDRALILYGGRAEPMPVSHLRIDSRWRDQVKEFFTGKTAPNSIAFDDTVAQAKARAQKAAQTAKGQPAKARGKNPPEVRKFEFNRE